MYFLKQDWLCQEFLYCLFLWAPLSPTCFSFLSLTPLSRVCILNYSVDVCCVFSSLSVLLLFPLLYSCMCTETKCISADNSLLWTWNSHLRVMITLPFTSSFVLACFNWVPSTASLSTSHEWWPDSRQHAMCQIKSQNHKWGFTAADSSTEKLSPALSLPFLPALFQQLPILPC